MPAGLRPALRLKSSGCAYAGGVTAPDPCLRRARGPLYDLNQTSPASSWSIVAPLFGGITQVLVGRIFAFEQPRQLLRWTLFLISFVGGG